MDDEQHGWCGVNLVIVFDLKLYQISMNCNFQFISSIKWQMEVSIDE